MRRLCVRSSPGAFAFQRFALILDKLYFVYFFLFLVMAYVRSLIFRDNTPYEKRYIVTHHFGILRWQNRLARRIYRHLFLVVFLPLQGIRNFWVRQWRGAVISLCFELILDKIYFAYFFLFLFLILADVLSLVLRGSTRYEKSPIFSACRWMLRWHKRALLIDGNYLLSRGAVIGIRRFWVQPSPV